MLLQFIDNSDILKGLVKELNSNGLCQHEQSVQSTPPFLSIINSDILDPMQILEWLDTVLQRVKPDDCYSYVQESKKFITPLAMLIGCMDDVIRKYEGLSMRQKWQTPDFPLSLVQRLVMSGSAVNAITIPINGSANARKRKGSKAQSNVAKMKKTIHPLTYAKDDINDWDNEMFWKQILEYFVKQGTVMNSEVRPCLTLTAKALSVLTQMGALKPENIPFKKVYEEMRGMVTSEDEEDAENDIMFDIIMFDEFKVYTAALVEELGPAIITDRKSKLFSNGFRSIMPEKFKNASSLKVLSRRAVRKSLAVACRSHNKMNMNSLIDRIPNDCLPRHLKEDFLKLIDFNVTVHRIQSENADFEIAE